MEEIGVNRECRRAGSVSEEWDFEAATCSAARLDRPAMDHIDKLSALIEMLIDEDSQIFEDCRLSMKAVADEEGEEEEVDDDEEEVEEEGETSIEASQEAIPVVRGPDTPKRKLPLRRRIDVAKKARDRGQGYETLGGKWMPPREQRPPCGPGCRLKCTQRLSEKDRQDIFEAFWSIADHAAQWDFIARNMRVSPKEKCTTVRGESRRSFTRTYYFQPREIREQVCKTMFLNTLGISNAWVATVCKKLTLNGFVSDDGRGKIGHRRKKVIELI